MDDIYTSCGIKALLVVCTYADKDGFCFYPSGPCKIGKERRIVAEIWETDEDKIVECIGTSQYANSKKE